MKKQTVALKKGTVRDPMTGKVYKATDVKYVRRNGYAHKDPTPKDGAEAIR